MEFVKLCLHYVPAVENLKLVGDYPIKQNQSEIDTIQWQVYRNELLSRAPKLEELSTLEFDSIVFRETYETMPYLDEIFYGMMIKPFYQTQLKSLQMVGTLNEKYKVENV